MKTLLFALLALLVASSSSAQTHNFTLTWAPPTVAADGSNTPTGIKIERKNGTTGIFAQVQSLGVVTAAQDILPNPAPGEFQYCYRIRWFNKIGDQIGYSPEACGVTAKVIVPVIPDPVTGFTLSAVSSSIIRMSWVADPANPTEIWGKSSRGWSQYAYLVGMVPDTATWDWVARRRYSTYCAKIRPIGGSFSEPVCATTSR